MDASEHVRAAQFAELSGDLRGAIESLHRAEAIYRQLGKDGRADQMLRHAERLSKKIPPREPPPRPASGGSERARRTELIERGPFVASKGEAAWCSFCCRPDVEVGGLIGGPTGAFICASCLKVGQKLLRGEKGKR